VRGIILASFGEGLKCRIYRILSAEALAPEAECELIQALGINDRGDIVAIGELLGVDRVVLLKRRD
jgi:hypothetical protein